MYKNIISSIRKFDLLSFLVFHIIAIDDCEVFLIYFSNFDFPSIFVSQNSGG